MEIGRDAARVYFQRCLAEAINRGYYDPGDEASARWAKGVSEALGGQQHEDLVLGGKLVSEVGQEQLMWATSLAHRRGNFLAWAISVVEGGKAPEEMMAVVAETATAVAS